MNPGKMNKCGEIHKKTVTRDSFGGEVITYVKYASAWFEFKPLRGKEFLQAQQVSAQQIGKITMRYDERVIATDRIIYKNRTFEINAAINVGEADRFLEIWYNEIK